MNEKELRVVIKEKIGNEKMVFEEFEGREWVESMMKKRKVKKGERIEMKLDMEKENILDEDKGKSMKV